MTDDESERQSVASDGSEYNEENDRQSEMTDLEAENIRDDMKGFCYIKFVGDKIYEQTDSELNLERNIEIDGDVYKLCGYVFTYGGYQLYFVKGMIFEQCEDSNIDMVSMGTNEIVQ